MSSQICAARTTTPAGFKGYGAPFHNRDTKSVTPCDACGSTRSQIQAKGVWLG